MRTPSRILIGTAMIFGAWAAPMPVRAALAAGHTYTVNSTIDAPDTDPTDGICASTASGRCTLRAAIMESNFATGPNTIILPAGTYTLTRPGLDDTALVGDLDIGHDLTLQGAGSAGTIVDGNGAVTGDRVFQILSTVQDVTLSGITIRNGRQLNGLLGGGGLVMEGAGHLLLSHVIIAGNIAQNFGGGLWAEFTATNLDSGEDQVTVQDSQVYSNTAISDGGGLAAFSDYPTTRHWKIERSEIYSNTARDGGGIASNFSLSVVDSQLRDNTADRFGGGLSSGGGQTTLDSTTFSGNVASQDGGGLYAVHTPTTLVNSTLIGNVSGEAGGGLYIDGGHTQLANATITGNKVYYTVADPGGLGGGLYLTHTAVITATNSIIAQNGRVHPRVPWTADDCSSIDSTGVLYYNLFTTLAYCTINPHEYIGNLVGADPLLGPLQDNGGSTPTQALLPGSPAIDAADPAGCVGLYGSPLATDQRGAARVDGHCDMGAYEVVPEADAGVSQQDRPDPARSGAPLTYTVVVSNTGPVSATAVVLNDTLPASAMLRSAAASQGSCLGTVTVTCNLGVLPNGTDITVTVAVTPTAAGVITDTVTVSANEFDPALANNSANETTTVAPQADLAVSQRDSPDPARTAAHVTYTVSLTNAGPDPAIAVVLTDTLPLSAVLETATPSQGSCVGVVIVTCNLGSIASGDHVTVTVAVTPTAAGLMTNMVTVTANDFDPALANNSATEATTVVDLRRTYLPLVQR